MCSLGWREDHTNGRERVLTALVSWALGYTASKLADKVIDGDLERRLRVVISKWADSVKGIAYIDPDALFSCSIEAELDAEQAPELLRIRKLLEEGQLPSEEKWCSAFIERWRIIKARHKEMGEKAQEFFCLSEEKATEHLRVLATRVHHECTKEAGVFNPHVVASLRSLREEVGLIGREIGQVLRLQGMAAGGELETHFTYRADIPVLDIPPQVTHLASREATTTTIYEALRKLAWVAVRGESGCGKTQLGILVAQRAERCAGWLSLRDCQEPDTAGSQFDAVCRVKAGTSYGTSRSELYRKACEELGAGTLLVIDDLPRLDGNDSLSRRLALFCKACASSGVTLLSLSNYELPTQLMAQIGSDRAVDLPVPELIPDEVKELFLAHGAPDEKLTDVFVSFFSTLSRGNATLLAALARHLEVKGWVYTQEEFSELVAGAYASELDSETIKKIVMTVQDSGSRELLYRLRLAGFGFSTAEVAAVARVLPEIERAIEKFEVLRGPWIQEGGDGLLRPSPLVRRLNVVDMDPQTQQATYWVLATQVLARSQGRGIDQWQAHQAIIYFLGARANQNAAALLSMVLHQIVRLDEPFDDAGLSLIWASQELPGEIPLGLRISLRGAQVAVRERLGDDTSFLFAELRQLADQATGEEGWGVLLATTCILNNTDLMAKQAQGVWRLLGRTLELMPGAKLPDGSELHMPKEIPPGMLAWICANQIDTWDQMRAWIDMLEQLTPSARETVFEPKEVDDLCVVMANKPFLWEYEKEEDSQQWETVLSSLDEFRERVEKLKLPWLRACIQYTKMVILGEHVGRFKEAVELARTELRDAEEDTRVGFLLQQYIGRQYYYTKDFAEARIWLRRAVEIKTPMQKESRIESLLCLAHIEGDEKAEEGIARSREAVSFAEEHEAEITRLSLVKAKAEHAVSKWLADDYAGAFSQFEEVCEMLLSRKPDTEFSKALFVRTATVIGGLSTYQAGLDLDVEKGQQAARPELTRGLFTGWGFAQTEHFCENRECYLMGSMSLLAERIGQDEKALSWATRAAELAVHVRKPMAVLRIALTVIGASVAEGDYKRAVALALDEGRAISGMKHLDRPVGELLDINISSDDILAEISAADRIQSEAESLVHVLLLTMFHLLRLSLSDKDAAKVEAERAATALRRAAKRASDRRAFDNGAELLHGVFSGVLHARDVWDLAGKWHSGNCWAAVWACYIGISAARGADLRTIARSHVTIMPNLTKVIKPDSTPFRLFVLPCIRDFWGRRFHEQRFRFSAPASVENDLCAAASPDAGKAVRHILKVIIQGLGIGIAEGENRWLRTGEAPESRPT